jgi:L-fuconolactonase
MSASGGYGPARICAGIVGHADLTIGERVQDVLDAHLRAGMGRFKGIRYSTARDDDLSLINPGYHPPPGLLADSMFRDGFARLAMSGLSYDSWVYHTQLEEVVALARAFPETTIILDHIGGPIGTGVYAGHEADVFAAWLGKLPALASCPNIVVKLGGLGMRTSGAKFHTADAAPGSVVLAAASRPFFEACIEAFGTARCMFESNFPVDKGSFSYQVFWNACKRISQDLSDDEKDDLFRRTAMTAYRLELPR